MSELECCYKFTESKYTYDYDNAPILKFKKMLLDTFYTIVQNRDLSEREEFGRIFTNMMNELCQPLKIGKSVSEELSGSSSIQA